MSAPTAAQGRAAPPGPPQHVTALDAAAARTAIEKLEAVGRLVTRALMTIGGGALIFTCVNVTLFAMLHGIPAWVAWMLDPLASIALLTVLYVDGVLAEQGSYKPTGWPFALRWFAGLSTWLMNCWTSIYGKTFALEPKHPDAGGILLHSVAPFLLITLAEASAGYRAYLAKRLAEYRAVIAAFEDAAHAAKSKREREVRQARELREREEREREQREASERTEREAREHEARLESERRREEFEIAQQQRAAEIEALRETTTIEQQRAQIADAQQRREAEIEAERVRLQAGLAADERDREAARQAQIIKAQAQAKAVEERAKLEREERDERRRQSAERRQRGRHASPGDDRATASESAGRHASENGPGPSESVRPLPPFLATIASENGGRVPRDVREQLREAAERLVAQSLLNHETPDIDALAKRFGKGETWVGDRVRAARRRLQEEPGFEDAVIAEALAEAPPVLASVLAGGEESAA